MEIKPCRFTAEHARTLRLSNLSVRNILDLDLHFHPYKMMMAIATKMILYGDRNLLKLH